MAENNFTSLTAGRRPPSLQPLSRNAPQSYEAEPEENGEPDATVEPHMVAYHDGEEVCKACSRFKGGRCSLLGMDVDPNGSCMAFVSGGGTEERNEPKEQEGE